MLLKETFKELSKKPPNACYYIFWKPSGTRKTSKLTKLFLTYISIKNG